MSTQHLDDFPQPIRQNGRLFWLRSQLEAYKRSLITGALGECPAPTASAPTIEQFVPADQVAKEFGIGRRTLGRRIAVINAAA